MRVHPQLSTAVTAAQQSELTHSVTATVTKVTTREKVSAMRQTRESPPPQKKRQVVVDSELRKRCVSVCVCVCVCVCVYACEGVCAARVRSPLNHN